MQGVWRQYDEQMILWGPYWADGDRNGARGQNCGVVRLGEDASAGAWADAACPNAFHYICERD